MTVTIDKANILAAIAETQKTVDNTSRHGGPGTIGSIPPAPAVEYTNAPGYPASGAVAVPLSLVLTAGTYYDRGFIDISWQRPTGAGSSVIDEFEVEITKVGTGVIASIRTVGTSARYSPTDPNTQYSVRVRSIDIDTGTSSNYTSAQTITTGADASLPRQVQGVSAFGGLRSVTIEWDENPEEDMREGRGIYDVLLDTVNTFNSVNLRSIRTSSTIVAFTDLTPNTQYYTKVAAIDPSNNLGPYSGVVGVVTQQAGGSDIGNGTVYSDHIVTAGLDAAVIKFGTMSGDRITTNTLDARAIKTSTLDASIITIGGTGMLRMGRTSSPFHYMIEDAAGIRGYSDGSAAFTGGTLSLEFNVNTGSAYFRGTVDASTINGGTITGATIRSAASGRRVEISPVDPNEIRLYSGITNETSPARLEAHNTEGRAIFSSARWGGSIAAHVSLLGQNGPIAGEAQVRLVTNDIIRALMSQSEAYFGRSNTSQLHFNTTGNVTLWSDGDVYLRPRGVGDFVAYTPNALDYIWLRDDGYFSVKGPGSTRMEFETDGDYVVKCDKDITLQGGGSGRFIAYTPNGADYIVLHADGRFYVAAAGGSQIFLEAATSYIQSNDDCSIIAGTRREIAITNVDVRTVDGANSSFQNHLAWVHSNMNCDPAHKKNIEPMTEKMLPVMRNWPVYRYDSTMNPETGRNIGMSFTDLPPEAQHHSVIGGPKYGGGELSEGISVVGADTSALFALALKSIQELADKLDQVIDKMPASNRPTPIGR